MPPTFTDEGARAAYEIKRSHPQVGVLVLSQHIETSHAIELVTLGGFGYLLKDRVLAVDEFLDAAERVARGGSALDPQVVGRLLGHGRHAGALAELSDREREVLELMAEGLTNAGIAERLFRQRAHRRDARPQRANQTQHPRQPERPSPSARRAHVRQRDAESVSANGDAQAKEE